MPRTPLRLHRKRVGGTTTLLGTNVPEAELGTGTTTPPPIVVDPPPPDPTDPTPPSSRRVLTGAYFEWDNPDVAIRGYEQFIERKLDLLLLFHDYNVQPGQTADPYDHLALPEYLSRPLRRPGNEHLGLWLGSSCVMRKLGAAGNYAREMTWSQLANGALDRTWRLQGERIQQVAVSPLRPRPRVRSPHELDLWDWHYSPEQNAVDRGAYKEAQLRYRSILKEVCPSVVVEVNPVSSGGNGGNKSSWSEIMPHPDAFDCLAFDCYDIIWGFYDWRPGIDPQPSLAKQEEGWNRTLNGPRGLKYLRSEAVRLGKPMSVPEWGNGAYLYNGAYNQSGGDNGPYTRGLAEFILDPAYPPGTPGGVEAHAYWEDGPFGTSSNGVLDRRLIGRATADEGRLLNGTPFPTDKARAEFRSRLVGATR